MKSLLELQKEAKDHDITKPKRMLLTDSEGQIFNGYFIDPWLGAFTITGIEELKDKMFYVSDFPKFIGVFIE